MHSRRGFGAWGAMLLVALLLSGVPTAYAATATKKPDPCSLATPDELSGALGTTFSDGQAGTVPGLCYFAGSDPAYAAGVDITVVTGGQAKARSADTLRNMKANGTVPVKVAGLGGKVTFFAGGAFEPEITLLRKKLYVGVSASVKHSTGDLSQLVEQEELVDVMKLVIAHL
jgi:hypothetical protein